MAEGFNPGGTNPTNPGPVGNPFLNPFLDSADENEEGFIPAVPQPQGPQDEPVAPTAPPQDGAASLEATFNLPDPNIPTSQRLGAIPKTFIPASGIPQTPDQDQRRSDVQPTNKCTNILKKLY